MDFLTINVSNFFRDTEQFGLLKTRVLPELLQQSPRLSIWSAGCSHGAEPYSVAIILAELSPGQGHRILATDIDRIILARARAGGPYTSADVKGVSRALLLKYFVKSDAAYWITKSMRQAIEFKQHDLLNDPFEVGFDLVICRNVTIYFAEQAKRKLNQRLCDSVKRSGVLIIGGTESMPDPGDMCLERKYNCFYRKKLDTNNRASVPERLLVLPKV